MTVPAGLLQNGFIPLGSISRGLESILHLQHGQSMTIGGGLQIFISEAEMNACQQLLGFITAAGKQGPLSAWTNPDACS